jgi:glucans biosynthesis protein C
MFERYLKLHYLKKRLIQMKPAQNQSSKPSAVEQSNISTVRYHYMDNIRALAMMLGIFFHAALAYSPIMQHVWPAADSQNSLMIDIVAWFSHLFRMPLFFLVSGFFALLLIEKRGIQSFIKNRSLRIALPFAIFLPICLVAVMGTLVWATKAIENPSSFIVFIKSSLQNPSAEKPPFSTMHLWFLFNLFQFCLVITVLVKYGLYQSKVATWLSSKIGLLVIFPILLVPSLYMVTIPQPAAERLYPEIWSYGYYGLFFFFGGLFYTDKNLLDRIKPFVWVLLTVSIGLYAFVYQQMPVWTSIEDAIMANMKVEYTVSHLMVALAEAFISVYMTLVCMVSGKILLDKQSTWLRFISDSSYWVYILHIPLLFYVQYLLLDVDTNLWVKFAISSFGVLFAGFISYVLFIRWTPIGWMLNGRKVAKKA